MTTETVYLLAGNYYPGFQNGPAPLGASFSNPTGLAYDASSGMVYIADSGNNVIRSLNLVSGNVSTFAGNGLKGYLDGPALQAQFLSPYGIAFDSSNGNVYIADTFNNRIRLINSTSGIVSTIAGTGAYGYLDGPALQAQFRSPYRIALDQSTGNIYIVDTYNYMIRLINPTSGNVSTIAGNGLNGYLDGLALQAEFSFAYGIAFDSSNGNIMVADSGNSVIRLINMTSGNVSTIAGNGNGGYLDGPALQAEFYSPFGIAFDSSNGNFMVADTANNRIRLSNIFSRNVSTIAGNGFASFYNGPVSQSLFNYPTSLAIDSSNGNIMVADAENNRIRLINMISGNVSTIAGSGVYGYLDGPALQAQFYNPYGIALNPSNGNIFVADTNNNIIRLINMTSGNVSTIAGTGNYGYLDGPALQAQFNYPYGIAFDSSNGNIFVADTSNSVIRLINMTSGNVSTFAGNGALGFSNGPALQAQFYNPYGIAFDSSNGNILVADTYNNVIRLINITSGNVSTFAGNGALGFSNGPALQAEFNNPYGVGFDSSNGNILIADSSNNRIAMSLCFKSFSIIFFIYSSSSLLLLINLKF